MEHWAILREDIRNPKGRGCYRVVPGYAVIQQAVEKLFAMSE